eukprot:jgi/Chlat1/4471/Chrsp29S04414
MSGKPQLQASLPLRLAVNPATAMAGEAEAQAEAGAEEPAKEEQRVPVLRVWGGQDESSCTQELFSAAAGAGWNPVLVDEREGAQLAKAGDNEAAATAVLPCNLSTLAQAVCANELIAGPQHPLYLLNLNDEFGELQHWIARTTALSGQQKVYFVSSISQLITLCDPLNSSPSHGIQLTPSNGAGSADVHARDKIATRRNHGQRIGKSNNAEFDVSSYPRRHVALHLVYLGEGYQGFASQGVTGNTVEAQLFQALVEGRLIKDRASAQYTRCGRTDRGVSAAGQVIALLLRSKHTSDGWLQADHSEPTIDRIDAAHASRNLEAEASTSGVEDELDYITILNKVLPDDIRVLGWSPVPSSFSARFSCIGREYKYYFDSTSMNIEAMCKAAQKLVGTHDFRNFCKMDIPSVKSFVRTITHFDIDLVGSSSIPIHAFVIQGSAFLRHQVRCMTSVLFMIGRGDEAPEVLDLLLDTSATPRKPQYQMASPEPLLLSACTFGGLRFRVSASGRAALLAHVRAVLTRQLIGACILSEVGSALDQHEEYGDAAESKRRAKSTHIPLLARPTEFSYEESLQRYAKTQARRSAIGTGVDNGYSQDESACVGSLAG